jgi:hypothetical protein
MPTLQGLVFWHRHELRACLNRGLKNRGNGWNTGIWKEYKCKTEDRKNIGILPEWCLECRNKTCIEWQWMINTCFAEWYKLSIVRIWVRWILQSPYYFHKKSPYYLITWTLLRVGPMVHGPNPSISPLYPPTIHLLLSTPSASIVPGS